MFFQIFLNFEIKLEKKKIYNLIILSLIFLNVKNFDRINNEIKRDDIYKFKNIPFYNQTEIFNYAYEDINESKLEKSNFFHIEILK